MTPPKGTPPKGAPTPEAAASAPPPTGAATVTTPSFAKPGFAKMVDGLRGASGWPGLTVPNRRSLLDVALTAVRSEGPLAANSKATGGGLRSAVLRVPANFYVLCKDLQGEVCAPEEELPFKVVFRGPEQPVHRIMLLPDGHFQARRAAPRLPAAFTSRKGTGAPNPGGSQPSPCLRGRVLEQVQWATSVSGKYTIEVLVGGEGVPGSPFTAVSEYGRIDPRLSLVGEAVSRRRLWCHAAAPS